MPRIYLHAPALRFCLPLAGTEESRPHLHGVTLDPDGTLSATNGHGLCAWRDACREDDGDAVVPSPFPYPVRLVFAKPNVIGAKAATVALTLPDDATVLRAGVDRRGGDASADVVDRYGQRLDIAALWWHVDARPVAWRSVMPRETQDPQPLPTIALATHGPLPAILDAAAKVLPRHATAPAVMTFYGAERGVLMQWPTLPDAVALAMPCRADDVPASWWHASPVQAPAAAAGVAA